MIQEHINFHAQVGIRITYTFQNDDGTPRDMTGKDVEVSVDNGFRKDLTIGSTSDTMTLTLFGSEVPSLVGKLARYIVLDKSVSPPAEVASGNLMVTGWL